MNYDPLQEIRDMRYAREVVSDLRSPIDGLAGDALQRTEAGNAILDRVAYRLDNKISELILGIARSSASILEGFGLLKTGGGL